MVELTIQIFDWTVKEVLTILQLTFDKADFFVRFVMHYKFQRFRKAEFWGILPEFQRLFLSFGKP